MFGGATIGTMQFVMIGMFKNFYGVVPKQTSSVKSLCQIPFSHRVYPSNSTYVRCLQPAEIDFRSEVIIVIFSGIVEYAQVIVASLMTLLVTYNKLGATMTVLFGFLTSLNAASFGFSIYLVPVSEQTRGASFYLGIKSVCWAYLFAIAIVLFQVQIRRMAKLKIQKIRQVATNIFYIMCGAHIFFCIVFGAWSIPIAIRINITASGLSTDLIGAFTTLLAVIFKFTADKYDNVHLKRLTYVAVGITIFLYAVGVTTAAVMVSVMAVTREALVASILYLIIRGFFGVMAFLVILGALISRFFVLNVIFHETTLKNTSLELETPLIETSITQAFEHDIQPWIVNVTDLSFDSKISEGAFGVVFRGKYKGSHVAIKKLKMINVDLEFENEVRMLMSLRHPNIVLFMGACIGDEYKFIVTEAMATSLDKVVHKHGDRDQSQRHVNMKFNTKLNVLMDVARAVSYMHQKEVPICHRDLKPNNILLDNTSSVAKICDLGTSRNVVSSATMTGNVGTFMYMSPEVLFNRAYTEKCDVYSYGIIMHEIFFEIKPYTGPGDCLEDTLNPFLLGSKVTQGTRPSIPDMSDADTREMAYLELMKRCWDQEPDNRPPFTEILATLENL